jgi:hypothetical protein
MASQISRAEEAAAEEPRWIPSFNIAFDAGDYDPDVSVDSSVGQSGVDDDAFDNLVFRLGGELMSPILGEVPGSPRLFARAGAGLVADTKVVTLEVGEVGAPEDDIQDFDDRLDDAIANGCETNDPPDGRTRGVRWAGERHSGDVQSAEVVRRIGDCVHHSPSQRHGASDQALGRVRRRTHRAAREGHLGDRAFRGRVPGSSVRGDHDHHGSPARAGAGAGVLLRRSARPIAFSIYVDSRFLWVVSDRTTQFSGLTEDSNGNPTGTATYTVERDSMDIRAGAGVRFSWMGLGAE